LTAAIHVLPRVDVAEAMHACRTMADQHKRGGQEYPINKRQEEGYDEAARGGAGVPPSDVGVPATPDESTGGDEFDKAARDAANDVRRHDKSAG
jgi:hypothetical protein